MVKFLAHAILLLIICVNVGCFSDNWHYKEVRRVKSPDGLVDAVFVEGNGGATTGLNYSIFLVPSGTEFNQESWLFKQDEVVFGENRQPEIELIWRNAKFLEIRYEKAYIYKFKNYWRSGDIQDFKHIVELRLVPLNEETSLFSE